MVKRGEIFRDSQYTYPAGNTAEKFLIVLNKIHLPTQPIVVTPCTTNRRGKDYHPGCNHRSNIFYIRAHDDFFENETIVELYIVAPIDEKTFEERTSRKILEPYGSLNPQNISKLSKCLDELKMDISVDLHSLLF